METVDRPVIIYTIWWSEKFLTLCRVVDSYLLNTLYLALSHDRESVQRIITLVNESHTKKRIVCSKESVGISYKDFSVSVWVNCVIPEFRY